VGVDQLQTVCSHVAFAEPIGVPGLFEQAIARVHRTGQQQQTINIYLFTAMKTVAVKLRNDLVKKEHTANMAVRDAKTLLFDLLGQGENPGHTNGTQEYFCSLSGGHDISSYVRLTKCKAEGGGR
jgi:hypothetical protein